MLSGPVTLFTLSDFKIFLTSGSEKDISDDLACVSYSKGGNGWFSAPGGCVHWLVKYWLKMAAFTHESVRETPFSINGGIEVHTLSPVTWRTVFHHLQLGMSYRAAQLLPQACIVVETQCPVKGNHLITNNFEGIEVCIRSSCSASDRQGSNFESCVWRTVSSQSSHHPQEVLLAQFSLYVHKGGLKPDSFHFFLHQIVTVCNASTEHCVS